MPKSSARCVLNLSSSMKLPGSSKSSIRSRAVSLPSWCCLSMRSCPPPSSACSSSAASFSRGESEASRSCRCADDIPPLGSGGTGCPGFSVMRAQPTLTRAPRKALVHGSRPPAPGAGVVVADRVGHGLHRRRQLLDDRSVGGHHEVLREAVAGGDGEVARSARGPVGGEDL